MILDFREELLGCLEYLPLLCEFISMKKTSLQYATALYELSQGLSEKKMASVVAELVKTLKVEGNAHLLPGVLKAYKTILVKKNELPEVVVRSARELDEKTIKDLLKELDIDKQTTVVSQLDPEMIGGVFVKNNNKLFDLSLARRLARLGQNLRSVK